MKVTATATKVKITPKMARELIEKHEDIVRSRGGEALNRNINDDLVAKYAAMMAADQWHLNGETIKVATTGRLLDGQHRVWASAHHDVSFETMVVSGLDEESFYTIDIGRSRKPSDFLTVDGIANGPIVAAAARLIIGYRRKEMKRLQMISTPEIIEFCKANGRISDSGSKGATCRSIAPVSLCAAWHFLFAEASGEDADKFIEDIKAGVGLSRGDPILALRERLIKSKTVRGQKLSTKELFLLGLKAWNDRRSGKTRSKVQALRHDAQEVRLPKVA